MAAGMVYAGRVVAVEDGGPRVVVPQLGGTGRYGPLPSAVPDLAVGDAVIVTSLGTTRDQLVILGRMTGRVPDIAEIPELAETLDAHSMRLDAVELDNRTDRLVLDGHDDRLTAAETVNGQQDGRLDATEGVAAGAAASAAAANTAATTLRADTAGRVTTKGDLLIATAAGTLARQPVVPTGWMLSGDPATATGWSSRDVLGLPRNLAGANTATRYVGGTLAGPPTTGTFAVGDFVISRDLGDVWVCTAAGTPGTWVSAAAAMRTELFGGPTRTVAPFVRVIHADGFNYQASQGDLFAQNGWSQEAASEAGMFGFEGGYSFLVAPIAGRYGARLKIMVGGVNGDGVANAKISKSLDIQQSIATDAKRMTFQPGESAVIDAYDEVLLTAGQRLYWSNWGTVNYTVRAFAFGAKTNIMLRYLGRT